MKLLSKYDLLDELKYRACLFFREKIDSKTFLINDRANNFKHDNYTVASISSTGYGLISLIVSSENKYISKPFAYNQSLNILRYAKHSLQNKEGWFYHFIDKCSGDRVWNCEISSIDTAIFIIGALLSGQYFKNSEVDELANKLYERLNWQWMLTNNGEYHNKVLLSHGWKPESAFLKCNWDTYSEHMFLYLLGLGSPNNSLSQESWDAWERPSVSYKGRTTLYGGPIFIHQMAHGFYNFKEQADRLGFNYWNTSIEATYINRDYCLDNKHQRKTYSDNVWGLNASDYPDGYKAFAAPGDEDGTVSPSGAIASIIFTPDLSINAATEIYKRFSEKIWGKYGFSNAFNIDRNWYDEDVIGIDLGMLLVSIENWKTGMIWELLASHSSTLAAWKKAGFKRAQAD